MQSRLSELSFPKIHRKSIISLFTSLELRSISLGVNEIS